MIILCKSKELNFPTYTQTQKFDGGGGTGVSNDGGYFYKKCVDDQCQWQDTFQGNPVPPPYQTSFGITRGPCLTQVGAQCWAGECGVLNNTAELVNKADLIVSSTTTASFKVTCIDGLITTSGETETFYKPTTAELVCTTSSNSDGTDVYLTGTFQKTYGGVCFSRFNLEEILVIPGNRVPLKTESTTHQVYTVCGGSPIPGAEYSVILEVTDSEACKKYGPAFGYGGFYDDGCDLYGAIKDAGKYYANTGIPGFESVSWKNLSETLTIKPSTSKTQFNNGQTNISFSNPKITLSGFSNATKSLNVTYFYPDYQNSVITSSSYKLSAVFDKRTTGTGTFLVATNDGVEESDVTTHTLFTVKAPCHETLTSVYNFTITKLAGITSVSTLSFNTTTQIGDYYLYDASSSARTYAILVNQFNFTSQSTIEGKTTASAESVIECTKTFPPYTYTAVLATETGLKFGGPDSPYPTTFDLCCTTALSYGIDLGYGGVPSQTTPDPKTFNGNCNLSCSEKSIECIVAGEPQDVLEYTWCGSTFETYLGYIEDPDNPPYCKICGKGVGGMYLPPKETIFSTTGVVEEPIPPEIIQKTTSGKTMCSQRIGSSYGQSVEYLMVTDTNTGFLYGQVFSSREWENGILYSTTGNQSLSYASTFSIDQGKQSFLTDKHVFFAFNGIVYSPMGGKTTMFSEAGKTTYIALATGPDLRTKPPHSSHTGDIHSYMISDPSAYKGRWEKASWPGYGVLRGQISTGTFKLNFSSGAATQKYAGLHSGFVGFANNTNDPRKIKITLAADGGLNLIKSKANNLDSSWVETFSTKAFTTSFDSSFKGAFFVKNAKFTTVATSVKTLDWAANCFQVGLPLAHCASPACAPNIGAVKSFYSDFSYYQDLVGLPDWLGRRVDKQSTYYERGDMSDVFLHNKASYLWTNPASSFRWGAGHGTSCS